MFAKHTASIPWRMRDSEPP